MKNIRPEPVVVSTVCSLCGQGWNAHGADPTTLDCIRLLKAQLRYQPQPWYPTIQPFFGGTLRSSNTGGTWGSSTTAATVTFRTPRDGETGQVAA